MKTGLQVALFALLGAASFGAVTLILRQTAEAPSPPAADAPVARYVPAYTIVDAGVEPPPRPAPPAGPYSASTPVQTLMGNPLLRQVVVRTAPGLGQIPQSMIDQAGPMSLRGARTVMPNVLTDQVLATLDAQLGRLTEAQVRAAAAAQPVAPAVTSTPPATVAAAAPSGAPAAAGLYSANTRIQILMGNPLLRQVVVQAVPALGQAPPAMINQAGAMTLRDARAIMPGLLTDQALANLDMELGKVTEAQVQAAAAQPPPGSPGRGGQAPPPG